jgi:hypothetical protein
MEREKKNINSLVKKPLVLLSGLRWMATVWSILAVGVVLVFAIGEGLNLSRFTGHELVLFIFFPVGVCLGLVLAWRWEGLGGGIAVGSMAAFYLVERLTSASFPRGFAFAALAAPGFLFLLSWLWARLTTKHGGI